MTDPTVNLPEVVAELRAAFYRYERALVANDVATMGELFWDDKRVVRFGISDEQRGEKALSAWRAAQSGVPPGRTLTNTTVTTFGNNSGVVTTVFRYPGRDLQGRQSQCWVRFPDGWRVVSAHVSEIKGQ